MTLQQIYYALVISDTGSMNKAAEKLYISQPALTITIRDLETELGFQIFFRTNKGVMPTNEGRDFLMYARQLYQQYEMILERYEDKDKRKVKFGVSCQHYSFAVKAFCETVKKYGTADFEFNIRETKTKQVISDVGTLKSEIGVIYLSDYNRKMLTKLMNEQNIEFHGLVKCEAFVYLCKKHPLADKKSLSFEELSEYPCLRFEQGENASAYYSEEILSENFYKRIIKAQDRATMLNLMEELNGYTLCSGLIFDSLNGSDYVRIPFRETSGNRNSVMEIGYLTKKRIILSEIGETYVEELKKAIKQ